MFVLRTCPSPSHVASGASVAFVVSVHDVIVAADVVVVFVIVVIIFSFLSLLLLLLVLSLLVWLTSL